MLLTRYLPYVIRVAYVSHVISFPLRMPGRYFSAESCAHFATVVQPFPFSSPACLLSLSLQDSVYVFFFVENVHTCMLLGPGLFFNQVLCTAVVQQTCAWIA